MENLILIAPPGSGKGTQSNLIKEKYNIPHISTGDLIRNLKSSDNPEIKESFQKGKLFDDTMVLKLLKEKIIKDKLFTGFILDGFPRNLKQTKMYDELSSELNLPKTKFIYINCDKDLLEKRIIGRYLCPNCGNIYNINFKQTNPKEINICDDCKEQLIQRVDDTKETFEKRYQVYLNETFPLIDYYKSELYTINGNQNKEEILNQITEIIDKDLTKVDKMKIAGKIVGDTHNYLIPFIKPGVTTKELDKLAYDFIISKNAIPSFLNYHGFPNTICASVNDVVVHGIPNDNKLKNGDILSIDIGACYLGYHGDSAWTYPVGEINENDKLLLENTKQALFEGLSMIKPGNYIGDIGNAIEKYAKQYKLGVVKELVGHGVGENLHQEPNIPNYGKQKTGPIIKEGMTLAIEPMLNAGKASIIQDSDGWTIRTKDSKKSAHFEHTVLVTKDGYEILTKR